MSRRILSLFFSLAAATCVSAHGFVSQVIIDGTAYAGNVPSEAADNKAGGSPIRQISTISPVKGADNPDINCGMGAQLAEVVAPANPGSNVTFQWSGGEDGGQNWPHNVGPLMTYMASCGSTSCSQFNGSTAKWFKIDELGMISGGNTWYQQDIMNGDSYSVTLPQSIAPGGYLIRHEIISLQLAMSMGGAEFYPSCTQVQIGGNGAGTPQSSQTVTFPGGYSDSDPGIYVPNLYNGNLDYVFPGPPVASLAAPGNGSIGAALGSAPPLLSGTAVPSGAGSATVAPASGTAAPSGIASASVTAAAPTSSASGSSTCKLKSSPSNSTGTLARRFHSRSMRRRMRHSS